MHYQNLTIGEKEIEQLITLLEIGDGDLRFITDQHSSIIIAAICFLLSTALHDELIIIGMDSRPSSANLLEVAELFLHNNVVLNAGIISTPILHCAYITNAAQCGMIITASHNSAEQNGLKIILRDKFLNKKDLLKLAKSCKISTPVQPVKNINFKKINYITDYLAIITRSLSKKHIPSSTKEKNLLSCTNSTIITTASELFKNFGLEKNVIISANHKHKNYTNTIIIDEDGDRIYLKINDTQVQTAYLAMIILQNILPQAEPSTVLIDLGMSHEMIKFINKYNHKVMYFATGHGKIKNYIKETSAIAAVESSGHIFLNNGLATIDDGIFAALNLMLFCNNIAKQIALLPIIYMWSAEVVFDGKVELYRYVGDLISYITNNTKNKYKIINIDGIRAEKNNQWFAIRASNTTNKMRIWCEGEDEKSLAEIKKEMLAYLLKFNNLFYEKKNS